jgi:DNA polymerase-3 subunit gamma/tau
MANHLASIAQKENIKYENDGLHIIAQKADGGLRDALSMFDQIVSFSGANVTYKAVIDNLNILDYDYYFNVTDSLLKEDSSSTLVLFDEILSKGFDGAHFISGLTEHLRNLLVGKDTATLKLLEVSDGIRTKYLQQSQASSVSFLLSAMNIANQCDLNYKLSKNQRLQVELALLKMCYLGSAFNLVTNPPAAMPDGQLKKKPDTSATVSHNAPAPKAESTPPPGDPPAVYGKKEPVQAEAIAPKTPTAEPVTEKPKVFIPNQHTAATSVKIPSLKDLGKAAEVIEDDDPYLKGDDKEEFTQDDFLKYWSEYAAKMKADGKKNVLSIFNGSAPVLLRPYVYEVLVGSKVLENEFKAERAYLLNFLRTSLRNFSIEVNPRIDEQAVVKRPYTNQEKFQHMAAKNPQLAELKKRFNLDFD